MAARRTRMNREGRLSNAKSTGWVVNYSGKDIIRGYRKWYAVDGLTAILELRCLGVSISEERKAQRRVEVEQKARRTAERKVRPEAEEVDGMNREDPRFFVAGYTPAGFPYGIDLEE